MPSSHTLRPNHASGIHREPMATSHVRRTHFVCKRGLANATARYSIPQTSPRHAANLTGVAAIRPTHAFLPTVTFFRPQSCRRIAAKSGSGVSKPQSVLSLRLRPGGLHRASLIILNLSISYSRLPPAAEASCGCCSLPGGGLSLTITSLAGARMPECRVDPRRLELCTGACLPCWSNPCGAERLAYSETGSSCRVSLQILARFGRPRHRPPGQPLGRHRTAERSARGRGRQARLLFVLVAASETDRSQSLQ